MTAHQTLTLASDVRFRAASGEGMFYDPFNYTFVDNSTHAQVDADGKARGSWVTLEAGATLSVVAAYGKGDTYCLVVNELGEDLASEDTYGVVVRQLSMEKILKNVVIDVHEIETAEEDEEAEEAEASAPDEETEVIVEPEDEVVDEAAA